jgi:Holliday junction resolvase-like predicted endonuclease
MAQEKIYVIKASGEREPFSEKKVRRSIKRAGIPSKIEEEVVGRIRSILYDNIPTREIYKIILQALDKSGCPHGKARYSLKQAIMALGPSGYPFEKFITQVLQTQGYQAEYQIIVRGKCAKHEIDVVAKKDNQRFLVECKFHNRPGIKTDIKTVLYVKARFDDVLAVGKKGRNHLAEFNQAWLVTNTKFTHRVIRYSECAGLNLLGWNYPEGDSLRDWVEKSNLHPITCLSSLSQGQKEKLLEKEIVSCWDLIKKDHLILKELNFPKDLIDRVAKEAQLVCGPWKSNDSLKRS